MASEYWTSLNGKQPKNNKSVYEGGEKEMYIEYENLAHKLLKECKSELQLYQNGKLKEMWKTVEAGERNNLIYAVSDFIEKGRLTGVVQGIEWMLSTCKILDEGNALSR
ncbi:MAG: hypothetical protein NT099_06895 [Candidatus Saganbacteria bacterium]|nr:hypothetical protein [Candidatus Saganbacteria bacterium]